MKKVCGISFYYSVAQKTLHENARFPFLSLFMLYGVKLSVAFLPALHTYIHVLLIGLISSLLRKILCMPTTSDNAVRPGRGSFIRNLQVKSHHNKRTIQAGYIAL